MSTLTIRDLVVYPVKALPGIHVTRGRVHPQGLQHEHLDAVRDRAFMIVDGQSGTFMSLRTHAEAFSKIQLALNEETHMLELSAPGVTADILRVDVSSSSETSTTNTSEPRSCTVWEWEGQGMLGV
jgi:uncharacterized protein YcbX